MKTIQTIAIYLICSINLLFAQEGINFVQIGSSWETIKEQAKKSNKPIFVDVYTEWCGPCKWMDQNVFNQKETGDFMNKNFINVKLDAEKSWGPQYIKTYGVGSYPTYLYFSQDGDMIFNAGGSLPINQFINFGKQALENLKNGISSKNLSELLKNKNADSDQLKKFITNLGGKDSRTSYLLDLYLESIPKVERQQSEIVELIKFSMGSRTNINSIAMDVLLEDYLRKPYQSFLITSPWNVLTLKIFSIVDSAGKEGDKQVLLDVNKFLDRMYSNPILNVFYKDLMKVRYSVFANNPQQALIDFENFINRYYINQNTDVYLKLDEEDYLAFIDWTYGIQDPTYLNQQDLTESKKRYCGFTANQLIKLENLFSLIRKNIPDTLATYPKDNLVKGYQSAVNLYKANQIYHNQQAVENSEKSIEYIKNLK